MRFAAVAHALPSRLVTNDDLLERVAQQNRDLLSADRLREVSHYLEEQLRRAGAVGRYHRDDGESALDFGVAAGRLALERADLPASSVDLLVYAGVGRGFLEPATANVFQDALHLSNATCFDILDACASWMRAVDIARYMLTAGPARTAMILNCEFNFAEYEPRSSM